MSQKLKHLIECHCILPQYRERRDPVYHKFVVFTELDEHDNVIPKHAQCNNCGVIHRVVDVGRSEINSGREASAALVDIADVKLSLPPNIVSVLETYAVDLATWEETAWILENQSWGSYIILASEEKAGQIEGKCLRFISPTSVKIEPYTSSVMFPSR